MGRDDTGPLEPGLSEVRGTSFAIAYRMLGSVTEAEDVVQEALLRVHRALEAGEQVASLRAYVATVTTRLAINELRSARRRREQYVGEWLPSPLIAEDVEGPSERAEMADSLSMALLVVLEALARRRGLDGGALSTAAAEKHRRAGGFERGWVLRMGGPDG